MRICNSIKVGFCSAGDTQEAGALWSARSSHRQAPAWLAKLRGLLYTSAAPQLVKEQTELNLKDLFNLNTFTHSWKRRVLPNLQKLSKKKIISVSDNLFGGASLLPEACLLISLPLCADTSDTDAEYVHKSITTNSCDAIYDWLSRWFLCQICWRSRAKNRTGT